MKTGLAWAIVRELVADAVDRHYATQLDERPPHPRVPALLVVWRDLYDALLTSFRSYRDSGFVADLEDPDALLGRAKRIPVLCLDDLGAGRERPTPFAIELLEVLVDRRYQGELPTIITSNFDTQEMADRLGHSDPVLGERIVTRLVEGSAGHRFTGKNVRRAA
jgi:DNA replication protein DnaC